MENEMEAYYGILGLYWDNGKENGSYYSILVCLLPSARGDLKASRFTRDSPSRASWRIPSKKFRPRLSVHLPQAGHVYISTLRTWR